MSTMGGLSRFAYVVGPVVGGWMSEFFGTPSVFMLQAALAILGASCIATFTPPMLPQIQESADRFAFGMVKTAILSRCGPLVRVVVFVCALNFVRKARELFFSLAGSDAGLSESVVGYFTALSFFFDMLGAPLAGKLMDTQGRRFAGSVSIVTSSVGILGLTFHSGVAVAVSGIVTGIGNGFSCGLLPTLGADLSPAGSARGPFLSVYRSMVNSAEFVAPALLGIIAQRSSIANAEVVSAAVGIFGAMWLLMCVPETLGSKVADTPVFTCCCRHRWIPLQNGEQVVAGETTGVMAEVIGKFCH